MEEEIKGSFIIERCVGQKNLTITVCVGDGCVGDSFIQGDTI